MNESSKYLIAAGPTNNVDPLKQYYADYANKLDKSAAERAAANAEKVKVAGEESITKLPAALATLSTSVARATQTFAKIDELNKQKEKEAFLGSFSQLHRKAGSIKAEQNFFKEVDDYRKQKINIFKDKEKLEAALSKLPEEVRHAYSKLNASTIVHAREYIGLTKIKDLNGAQHKVFLSQTPGALDAFNALNKEDRDTEFRTWQLKELSPYALSDGLIGETLSKELERQASTRRGTDSAQISTAIASERALAFRERAVAYSTAGNDNTAKGTWSEFIVEEIRERRRELGYQDASPERQEPLTQQATESVIDDLSQLAASGDKFIDIPELLAGKIEGVPSGDTISKAFLDPDGAQYNQLMDAWDVGQSIRVSRYDQVRDGTLSQNLALAKDGRLTESQRALALKTFISQGGSTESKQYKELERINLAKQNKETAEQELSVVNEAFNGGRVNEIKSAIANTTNDSVSSAASTKLKVYEQDRIDLGFGKENSDDLANKFLERNKQFNLARLVLPPGSVTRARDLVSQRADVIIQKEIADARGRKETILGNRELQTRINRAIEEDIDSLGFNVKDFDKDDPNFGILTPNSEGEYPLLQVDQGAKLEYKVGSNFRSTYNTINYARKMAKEKGPKGLEFILNQKGMLLSTEEIVAVAENIKQPGFTWPPDLLLKADLLGIDPSELYTKQLQALTKAPSNTEKGIIAAWNLEDESLIKDIPQSGIQVREFLENKDPGDLLAKYNLLGASGFSPNMWQRLISLEKDVAKDLGIERVYTEKDIQMRELVRKEIERKKHAAQFTEPKIP